MAELITADSCSAGWLRATRHILQSTGDCFNVVVEIRKPSLENLQVRELLDGFLETLGKRPVEEVANTIFPCSLYSPLLGRTKLYENYETAWPLIKLFNSKWGTYFYRMIHWEDGHGPINQMEDMILKLRRTNAGGPRYRSVYEISIYRPGSDRHIPRGGPCLSHLSFKLDDGTLHLTAIYRNHYYIERAYGNFVGLGRLMQFVADESGLSAGQLTCVSTHAEVDASRRA